MLLSASRQLVAGCSDVICDFPLREMLAYHKQKKAEGTILVTKVSTQAAASCLFQGQRHQKTKLSRREHLACAVLLSPTLRLPR